MSLLDTVNAQIAALTANPQVDQQVGAVRFANSQKLKQLLEVRKHLADYPETELEFVSPDFDINLNGTEDTQFTVL